ncbi:hypothetical protein V6N13_019633 [Hibiscus sabdariffa]|uniref:Cytochrome P450 n=1 Tax=Hibiscus sabdariffa TaxID=183260 RepID=A0ABR2EK30_9ROSI
MSHCMEFRPERWLSPQGHKFDPPKDGRYNAGARTCLGKDLAGLPANEVSGLRSFAAVSAFTGSCLHIGWSRRCLSHCL